MMTAPFVHRGKQKTKDRPFESYFTTAKPSFILVEWLLDGGAGYVLTGLMVRKNQEISEEKTDALEMMAIISEYKEPCMQDIHHLPVVEQNEKTMKLKSYNSCRKLFEDYKKDKKISFFCYDMSSPAQSRQYFYKLMEYQINYKEWETIIRKVNVKESGLSELFSDCRTEKELVEKWFLEAVESKLNKEENKVNKIDAVKVNGTALGITDKAVNIDLSNYATKSTTLAGYGITNAYTKDEVNTELGKKANSSDVYTKTEVNDALANKLSNTDVIDGGTF